MERRRRRTDVERRRRKDSERRWGTDRGRTE